MLHFANRSPYRYRYHVVVATVAVSASFAATKLAYADARADAPPSPSSRAMEATPVLSPAPLATTRLDVVLGYGLAGPGFEYASSPFGLGLGVQGGALLGQTRLYLGGTAVFHFGDLGNDSGTRLGYVVGEFGYDALVGSVSFVPYLGVGGAVARYKTNNTTQSSLGVAVTPGLRIQSSRRGFSIGADLRLIGTSAEVHTSADEVSAVSGAAGYLFVGRAW